MVVLSIFCDPYKCNCGRYEFNPFGIRFYMPTFITLKLYPYYNRKVM